MPDALGRDRTALEPRLAALDAAAGDAGRGGARSPAPSCSARDRSAGAAMRAALHRALARAFDIADVARLRDRAKLHVLVDATLASAVGRFAGDVADLTGKPCAPVPRTR